MRILTVVSDLGPGGTQRAAQNFAVAYQGAGHASAVLGFEGGGPRTEDLERAGVKTFVGGTPSDQAVRDAVAWRPDVVHVHRRGDAIPSRDTVLLSLAQALTGATFIETNVFSRADPGPTGRVFDVHLQLTPWGLWKWRKWSRDIRPRPVGVVIPYIVDPTHFYRDPPAGKAFRDAHGLPHEALVFGRVGQPHEAKWMAGLVDAFARVAGERPDAHLLLVGAPPSVLRGLSQLDESARGRVRTVAFLHGDAALRGAYNAFDVFVLAAQIGESFGMVIAESMLCETPVVALSRPARDNSQIDVVGHGEGGLVAASASALPEAMGALADDAALRERLGVQAAARIHARYVPEVVVPMLLRVVQLARESATRADLQKRLDLEPGLVTAVSDADVRALLEASIGETPLRDRLLAWAVHQPKWVRLWRRLREPRGTLIQPYSDS